MNSDNPTQPNTPNPEYMKQMLVDLEEAENLLRHAISNRHNPFADNGNQRLTDCQANVDRLHELIRTYTGQPKGARHE